MLNTDFVGRMIAAIRNLREAEDQLLVMIEEAKNFEENDYDALTYTEHDLAGNVYYSSREREQGDDLSRGGSGRDDEVRYHRGSKASDERPF